MKILILDFKSFGIEPITKAFMKLGHQVVQASFTLEDIYADKAFDAYFDEKVNNQYDMIFTFNYYPVISNNCNRYHIPYVSWVYDNPHVALYSFTVVNPCNYIFIFDREMYLELKNGGIPTVFHLPLAVNPDVICNKVPQFDCDVAFVGSLYNEKKHRLYERFETYFKKKDPYVLGYLDGILEAQLLVYGYFMLEELLTDPIYEKLQEAVPYPQSKVSIEHPSYIYASYFLGRRVTELERTRMIGALEKVCNFHLHTHSSNPVDYYNDMPSVFASARINLNITLKSIRSGIPLRAFDILGAGGFLLSNYQAELGEHFIPDEDFVYYESIPDAIKKVQYYLANPSLREQIAANGHGKALEYHTYEHRVREILNTISSIHG